jgi:hypothetical protein
VHSAFMPLDIAAEARSWRDSHGGPGETTPEQIFCLQLLTERMWRAAARNRRSGSMRLREGLRSNRRCDVSVLARIMEDYAFLCIYASRRNALNSA